MSTIIKIDMQDTRPTPRFSTPTQWFYHYWPSLLVMLAFFGFISKSLYQYPVALMAIIGLVFFVKNPLAAWKDETLRLFIILFLCLWLPLLFSFIDAYNLERSARTVFPYLRFLFAGIFIIRALSDNEDRLKLLSSGLAFMVGFWTIDASIQFFFGRDLFGYPHIPGHMVGMFYPELQLSHICSILSPFLFLYIYNKQKQSCWPFLLLLPLFFVILLAGRRASYIMLALCSFGFLAYALAISEHKKRFIKQISISGLLISALLIATVLLNAPAHNRFHETLGLFSSNYQEIDKASSRRLSIWETAIEMVKDNPINGIGPRGFRFAYPEYAPPGNYWDTQTHPHLLGLEILVETGLIGIVAYLLMLYLLVRFFLRLKNSTDTFPFLLPVLVALFPFNTHMAFYGSLWSSMSWLLLMLFIAQARMVKVRRS